MVAIEHRPKSSTTTTTTTTINASSVLSPTSSSLSSNSSATTTTTSSVPHLQQEQELQLQRQQQQQQQHEQLQQQLQKELSTKLANKTTIAGKMSESTDSKAKQRPPQDGGVSKSAVSQRNVDVKIAKKSQVDATKQELTKKMLKLDLSGKELDEFSLKSPKSPITARLPHQTSLTSSVDVEDRKTLREALYQGIFHRHRRTIFAVGSFLRMLRSRNSSYNTIRSSSEGEDVDEVR